MSRTALIRAALGLSQKQLGERLRVDQSSVHRMECGKPESGPVSLLLDQLAVEIGRPDLVRPLPESAHEPAAPSPGKSAGVSP